MRIHFSHIVFLGLVIFVLSGCAGQKSATSSHQVLPAETQTSLACIGVVPVSVAPAVDERRSASEEKELQQGRKVFQHLVEEYFGRRADVRFATVSGLEGMQADGVSGSVARIRRIANLLSCNGILEIELRRYRDRLGSRYSAEHPASAAFAYRLWEANSGTVLCQGQFDETQESVMENLFSFSKARQRGFTWITIEELLREGLREKFQACPYLQTEK